MLKPRFTTLLAFISIGLLAGCASAPQYTPAPFSPVAIDTSNYGPKVDAFAVVLDASSSMNDAYQGQAKSHIAKDSVNAMSQTIPELNYNGTLVAFGTGRCTGGKRDTTLYGPARYSRSAFDAGLNSLECAGGITPMADGLDGARRALKAETGKVAIILVSDFWNIDVKSVKRTIAKLKANHGDNLCLHTVQVGDSKHAPATVAAMIDVVGCGDSVMAGDIADAGAMAGYVTRVLLAPLQYTHHTVSATALFDFDKAVLKQQGKDELHRLDESIKAQGVRVADIDVVGHTDSIGSAAYNKGLSLRRAKAVRNYMVSEGIDGGIIDVSGMGESQPVAGNATSEGRALNRRVEIHVGAAQAGL